MNAVYGKIAPLPMLEKRSAFGSVRLERGSAVVVDRPRNDQ